MGRRTTGTLICDACRSEISSSVTANCVDLQVYGVLAHPECFARLEPRQVLRLLGLDDVKLAKVSEIEEHGYDQEAERYWAPTSAPAKN